MADHYAASVDQLEKAKATRAKLSGQLGLSDRDQREINRLANQVRAQVKLAEVHALLAIAQGLEDLRLPS
jgi:hypothetical protein